MGGGKDPLTGIHCISEPHISVGHGRRDDGDGTGGAHRILQEQDQKRGGGHSGEAGLQPCADPQHIHSSHTRRTGGAGTPPGRGQEEGTGESARGKNKKGTREEPGGTGRYRGEAARGDRPDKGQQPDRIQTLPADGTQPAPHKADQWRTGGGDGGRQTRPRPAS